MCKLALGVYFVVQVPSRNTKGDPLENLEQFKTEVPVLGLLGTPVPIEHTSKFTITGDVQLVCKYLKAFETEQIDRLYRECKLFYEYHNLLLTVCLVFLSRPFSG